MLGWQVQLLAEQIDLLTNAVGPWTCSSSRSTSRPSRYLYLLGKQFNPVAKQVQVLAWRALQPAGHAGTGTCLASRLTCSPTGMYLPASE